ncbi:MULTISPECIES: TonB-dependent receptor [unclassified Sphingobium]|uniref:TonB-dependent receptor n=1 Tax=unclassified Sphingobium TaxID=2611147 RepID=UPI00076FE1D2|nr:MULTISPECIES: TonB-dependent receptor [Sphingomonadaceae]AMK24346.1 TonB-dependent receptor-like protein [Sphingobium sp. TKS]NML90416.1 TonB-dependent receptor [Sphingobium sp. TB-6]
MTMDDPADRNNWFAPPLTEPRHRYQPIIACASAAALAVTMMSGSTLAQTLPSATGGSGVQTSDAQLEEIVVTAQHRSQRLQDVPVAVTSLSATALEQQGVSGTSDLAQAVPSLIFTSQLSAANPYIRGVGSQLFDPVSESPVAVYVDDVYIANPQGNVFSLAGTRQIDVLNGPQGTLFGRNATGGVIQIQTLDPEQTMRLDLSGTYGNYDMTGASAYLSGGLTDGVAASISVLYENQAKGFGRNLLSGDYVNQQARHNISLRSKWLFEPSDSTTIRLSADYARLGNTNSYQRPRGSVSLLPDAIPPIGYPGEYNSNGGLPNFTRLKTGGGSMKIDQDIGSLALTSITAYRELRNSNSLDQDQTSVVALDLTWRTKFHSFSQEVRLQNASAGKFNWILGAFYYNALGAYVDLRADGMSFIDYEQQRSESFAVFGQATLELFRNLNLTGGIRYTTDKQTLSFPTFAIAASQNVKKLTYRVALDYRFSSDIMGYISYNTGFKSGGYNLLAPGNAFQPEELDALEFGLKTELFDRSVRLNLGAFFYWYHDQQVSLPDIGGNLIKNAAGSRIKGLEASLDYRASSRLKISGGLSLMDGHYTDYPGFQAYDPNGLPLGPPANMKGRTTVQTPDFVGNISGQYTLPTQVGDFAATLGVQHNGGFFATPDNRLEQPSYTLVNASLSWLSNDKRIGVKLWGKNLFDDTYYVIQSASPQPVADTQIQAPPRTVGVTLSYHL